MSRRYTAAHWVGHRRTDRLADDPGDSGEVSIPMTENTPLPDRQARAYHTMALTSRGIPVCREVIETAHRQSRRVDQEHEHGPELEELAESFDEASRELAELARLAGRLADS